MTQLPDHRFHYTCRVCRTGQTCLTGDPFDPPRWTFGLCHRCEVVRPMVYGVEHATRGIGGPPLVYGDEAVNELLEGDP